MVKIPGGSTRPENPPSVFTSVPSSCLPTTKPPPRPPKQEDQQLSYFLKKDKILSFAAFSPEKELSKKYSNLIISKSEEKFVCLFMSQNYEECNISIIVYNKQTLCSPLVLNVFKNGISIPMGKILNPNNGLASYSQFFECVHHAIVYEISLNSVLDKIVNMLELHSSNSTSETQEVRI